MLPPKENLMLAVTGDPANLQEYEDSGDWILEEKYDGERVLIIKQDGWIRAFSRNWKEVTQKIPEIIEALSKYPLGNIKIDGEIFHLDDSKTAEENFKLTSSRMRMKVPSLRDIEKIPLTFIMFDLPDIDIMQYQIQRKQMLSDLFSPKDEFLKVSKHYDSNFVRRYERILDNSGEGVMLKNKYAPYERKRSKHWLKIIPKLTEDVVAIGMTEGNGKNADTFGALLCKAPNGEEFKAGPGNLTEVEMKTIRQQIDFGILEFPFVVEISLKSWYPSGKPRQPRIKCVRYDKYPEDCRIERPVKLVECKEVKQFTLGDF
jgi:ATP-dependent DNA ligase